MKSFPQFSSWQTKVLSSEWKAFTWYSRWDLSLNVLLQFWNWQENYLTYTYITKNRINYMALHVSLQIPTIIENFVARIERAMVWSLNCFLNIFKKKVLLIQKNISFHWFLFQDHQLLFIQILMIAMQDLKDEVEWL